MRTRHRGFVLLLAVLPLAACAGTPGPGDAGYPFNVAGTYGGTFSVEGMSIGATLEIQTGPGGAVTGQVQVAEMGITADVDGSVLGDKLTLRIPYMNPGSGCSGTAEGTATVTDGGASFSGPLTITECGTSMGGSLSFRRR